MQSLLVTLISSFIEVWGQNLIEKQAQEGMEKTELEKVKTTLEQFFCKGEQENGTMAGWGLGCGVKERYYCFFMVGENRASLSYRGITIAQRWGEIITRMGDNCRSKVLGQWGGIQCTNGRLGEYEFKLCIH